MASFSAQIGLLALAGAAVAQPQHGHQHAHRYHSGSGYSASGSSAYGSGATAGPYGYSNATAVAAGTGTAASGSAYASASGTETTTGTTTLTSTIFSYMTVYPDSASASGTQNALPVAGSSGACGGTVTTTFTNTVTVTATAGAASGSSSVNAVVASSSSAYVPYSSAATAGSSSYAAPASKVVSPKPYSAPASSSTAAASSYVAASSSSSSSAAASSSYAPSSSYGSSASASSTASSSSPSGGTAKTKRGCNYNFASACNGFDSSVSWAWNWASTSKGSDGTDLNSEMTYIPILQDPNSPGSWSTNAKTAVDNGAPALFGFNEPDQCGGGGTCTTPEIAASSWQTNMQPFAGGSAHLVAPSITNGYSDTTPLKGAPWLQSFLDNCSGCQIDAIQLHWYGGYNPATTTQDYLSDFQNHISSVHGNLTSDYKVWITEFGIGAQYSDDGSTIIARAPESTVNDFLNAVVPWLEAPEQDYIVGYTYFMADQALTPGAPLTNNGPLTQAGTTFQSAQASS